MRPDRFDLIMTAAIGVLLAAIGVVVVRGDQIGIAVQNFGPMGSAGSRSPIHVVFGEPISDPAIDAHFAISPAVPGSLTVSQNQITFLPAEPLAEGQDYTVTIKAGIQSAAGRLLKQDVQWHFVTRRPWVTYLGPVDNIIRNVYLVNPASPGTPQALTNAKQGILGYDPAPDGRSIVYTPLETDGTASLFLWDAETGTSHLLYQCKDAACTSPSWRPDGGAIAFERVDLNSGTGMSAGAARVWVFDLSTNTAQPLFQDRQRIGYMPRWSPDGTKLAVVSGAESQIVIHDYPSNTDTTIPVSQGEVGPFSPDGKWLYFPEGVDVPDVGHVTHLVLVDLASDMNVQHDLVPDLDPSNDMDAVWLADSKHLVVMRSMTGTSGADNPQLFRVDISTGAATPLIDDPAYSESNLSLDPSGRTLLFERSPMNKPGAHQEIWIYNLATQSLQRIASNGTAPRWMP